MNKFDELANDLFDIAAYSFSDSDKKIKAKISAILRETERVEKNRVIEIIAIMIEESGITSWTANDIRALKKEDKDV